MSGAFETKKARKNRRVFFAGIMMTLGVVVLVVSLWIITAAISSDPVMLRCPDTAVARAEEAMNAICAGDYEAVSATLYGRPSLGTRPENSSPAADLIWDTFRKSITYSFAGDCYATQTGVAIDVQVKHLDVSATLEGLGNRVESLLAKKIADAEDSAELYDEDNNFRKEIIEEVLQEATLRSLMGNETFQEQTVQLQLVFDQGQWWVLPDAEFVSMFAV